MEEKEDSNDGTSSKQEVEDAAQAKKLAEATAAVIAATTALADAKAALKAVKKVVKAKPKAKNVAKTKVAAKSKVSPKLATKKALATEHAELIHFDEAQIASMKIGEMRQMINEAKKASKKKTTYVHV